MNTAPSPSYLYQVFQSDSESEDETEIARNGEKVALVDDRVNCFLCGDQQKCCCDVLEVLEACEYTFSEVLSKLFSREQLPDSLAEKDYSQGLLCTYCKYLVSDLFRLQRELKTVKNVIVRTFKSSENKDVKAVSTDGSDNETAKDHKITKGRENSADSDRAKQVKSKKSSNQKRKRGNKWEDAEQQNKEETKSRIIVEEDSAYTTDDEKDSDDEPVYNIEAIITKKGSTYLVKWENYPDDQNSWEPRRSIPDLVIQYYEEDTSRIGKPLPSDFSRFEDDIHEEDDDDDDMWKPESLRQTPKEKQSFVELKQKEIKRKRKRESQSTGDSNYYFVRNGGESEGGDSSGGIKRKLFSEPTGPQILN